MKPHSFLFKVCVLLGFAALLWSCSRQKDAFLNRTYHNMTTKFNIHHNGYEAFIKGRLQVESGYKLNYDTLLPVYLWPTETQATSIKPDMDKAIDKGQKSVREHSMVIGNNQKNKMIDDAYMLIGFGKFYNRDFFAALETFQYTSRQFPKSDNFFNAQLWTGRTHVQMNNFLGAATSFEELYKNRQVPKHLRSHIAASMAEMYIRDGQFTSAVSKLEEARKKHKNKKEVLRWTFLQGQVEAQLGRGYEASQLFEKVAKSGAPYEMKFKAQLFRARSFDVYMESPTKIYKELAKMLKDDKNIDAKDEIYYTMAEIALKEEDFTKAEDYLEKSIRSSTINAVQKGLSYLKRADIDFEFKAYVRAKAYYDSAATSLGSDHPKQKFAAKRSKTLERLVANLNIIELEDSLQRLAAMPDAVVRKIFEDYIKELEQAEAREKAMAEAIELQKELAAESQALNVGQVAGGSGGWYFYNSTVRNSGLGEFNRRWGKRTLEDDWRRKNKPLTGAGADVAEKGNTEEGGGDGSEVAGKGMEAELEAAGGRKTASGDPKDINYYLNQIPKNQADIDSSNIYIQRAFLEVASAYKEELNDFLECSKTLETLDKRFPEGRYEPKMLYVMYLVYGKLAFEPQQARAKERLLKKFPNHIYTRKVLDPNFGEVDNSEYLAAQLYYNTCYQLYKEGQYKESKKCLDKGIADYKQTDLRPKLELLEAILVGKLDKEPAFIEALKKVQGSFPNTPEATLAGNLLAYLGNEAPVPAPSKTEVEDFGKFVFDAKEKHNYVLLLPNNGVDINQIRNEVSNHNAVSHRLERLQVRNIFLNDKTQLIIVSGFKDKTAAEKYDISLAANEVLTGYLPKTSTEKMLFGEKNFQIFYSEKDLEGYRKFYQKFYQ